MPTRVCDIGNGRTTISRDKQFGEGDFIELTISYWLGDVMDHTECQTWRIVHPGSYGTAAAEMVASSKQLSGIAVMPSDDAWLGSGIEQAVAPHGFE